MLRQSAHRTLCSCFLLFGFVSSGAPADLPDTIYRKDVSEVRLTFYATDQKNRTVPTIRKSDLAIVDSDEVIHDIRSLQRSDTTKLDLVLLVDCSESVQSRFRRELADVLQVISQSRWLSDDQVSVISFCGSLPALLENGFARDLVGSDRILPSSAGGDTPLYDAIEFAENLLEQHRDPEKRAAILLFSDGLDSSSRASATEALDKILQTDTQIYSIDLDSRHLSRGTQILHTYAESTEAATCESRMVFPT